MNRKFNHKPKLEQLNLTSGDIHAFPENDIFIFYLIYKPHHWEKCSYETIFDLISKLKIELLRLKINSINLPRIGTHFDNLHFKQIRAMLRFVFRNSGIEVNIFHDVLTTPDDSQIPTILEENHSSPTVGHSGYHKTYNRINPFTAGTV